MSDLPDNNIPNTNMIDPTSGPTSNSTEDLQKRIKVSAPRNVVKYTSFSNSSSSSKPSSGKK